MINKHDLSVNIKHIKNKRIHIKLKYIIICLIFSQNNRIFRAKLVKVNLTKLKSRHPWRVSRGLMFLDTSVVAMLPSY